MKSIIIFGATSCIAQQVALKMASGAQFFLVARDEDKLTSLRDRLLELGASQVHSILFDAANLDAVKVATEHVLKSCERIDNVIFAQGVLPASVQSPLSSEELSRVWNVNVGSIVLSLSLLQTTFKKQNSGSIAVLSSVAGERARKKNYVYGSAKAALSLFCDGFRNDMRAYNVQLITVKLGPVVTPMTRNMNKGLLWAQPQTVARSIAYALENQKNAVMYAPFYWRPIMWILKQIPEVLFQKLP